jgi:hypothetical protein
MTNVASNSGLPAGVGGKDTSALIPGGTSNNRSDVDRLVDGVVRNRHRENVSSREHVERENNARSNRNSDRADRRQATSGFVSDDEDMLDLPDEEPRVRYGPSRLFHENAPLVNAFSAFDALTPHSRDAFHQALNRKVGADKATSQHEAPTISANNATATPALAYTDDDVKMVSSIDDVYEIPRVIINLALAKMHVPLTLLTAEAMERIHTDPSCVKMKKGIVLDDPKRSIMDSSSFPPETSLPPAQFNEASKNFINLLAHVASPLIIERFKQHRDFCLSRKRFDENFQAILTFDIETRRIFFNTKTFFTEDAYKRRWEEIQMKVSQQKSDEAAANANREAARISALVSRLEGSGSSNRYNPYPPKPKTDGTHSTSDGKSFRKGKGAPSDGPLCLLCGQNGHKASDCTFTHTIKNTPVVCVWQDKIILKSSSAVVCISHNIGRCTPGKHGTDIIHVCSVCGSKAHGASSKAC